MSKKPHVLWKIIPPIVAVLAGFGYVMFRGFLGISTPLGLLELGFLITTGIVCLGFPFLSRCWLTSLLSPVLYFTAIFISSRDFALLAGLDVALYPISGVPLMFTPEMGVVFYMLWGILSLAGLLIGLGFTIIRAKSTCKCCDHDPCDCEP